MSIAGAVRRALRQGAAVLSGRQPSPPRLGHTWEIRTALDIDLVAARLGDSAPAGDPSLRESLIRELVALDTPALFIDVAERPGTRVVLRPWDRPGTRFVGNYLVEAGSGATEGSEAFVTASHDVPVFVTAPDHPVHVIALHHLGRASHEGRVGADVTHVTIVINGHVVARSEKLSRERVRMWAAPA